MQKGNEIHPQYRFLGISYISFHLMGCFPNGLFQQEACDYLV